MTGQIMTKARVLDLIETYGADPSTWPRDEREAARRLIDAEPESFALALSQAQVLDGLLATTGDVLASDDLFTRVLDQAPQASQPRTGLVQSLLAALFPQGAKWPAGAALASLAMGAFGGYAYASLGAETVDPIEAAYASAFGFETSETWTIEEAG